MSTPGVALTLSWTRTFLSHIHPGSLCFLISCFIQILLCWIELSVEKVLIQLHLHIPRFSCRREQKDCSIHSNFLNRSTWVIYQKESKSEASGVQKDLLFSWPESRRLGDLPRWLIALHRTLKEGPYVSQALWLGITMWPKQILSLSQQGSSVLWLLCQTMPGGGKGSKVDASSILNWITYGQLEPT